ncbi:Kinesin light chain [Hondaea fermentalgiana]|uniref:Kinesin light chain n=1 Tax=Hondaea fermentalgiana TaxID=2315210 RepID=A0A2R5GP61_9STRA|nr:Kinesin light chain [Hondaea fermentalgiana]|eukprot:GBG32666.1 Kinesin light chain [Hondaea fermentalgiana]
MRAARLWERLAAALALALAVASQARQARGEAARGWGDREILESPQSDRGKFNPAVACDADNDCLVAFTEKGNRIKYKFRPAGGSWSDTAKNALDNSKEQEQVQVAVYGGNKGWVLAFRDATKDTTKLHSIRVAYITKSDAKSGSKWTGSDTGVPLQISQSFKSSSANRLPSIAADNKRNVVLVWETSSASTLGDDVNIGTDKDLVSVSFTIEDGSPINESDLTEITSIFSGIETDIFQDRNPVILRSPYNERLVVGSTGTLFGGVADIFVSETKVDKMIDDAVKDIDGDFTTLNTVVNDRVREWHMQMARHAVDKARQREDGEDLANILRRAGILFKTQSSFDKALAYYKEALSIYKESLGDRHPSVADTLNSMANVYYDQGHKKKALAYYEEALSIYKESLGDRHPDVAATLHNIASVYVSQGRKKKALACYEEALSIRKEALGDRHPDVATTLNNIANVYQRQGRNEEALAYCEEALSIRKESLGDRHVLVADTLFDIAFSCDSQGRYEEALAYYEEALSIYKESLGAWHRSPSISTASAPLVTFDSRHDGREVAASRFSSTL